MSILAGMVILYNPDEKFINNILSYIDYVERLYVIDNSENVNINIIDKLKTIDKIDYIYNGGNLGISISLNKVLNLAKNNYKYLLTMDQDSYFKKIYIEKYIKQIKFLESNNIISLSLNLKITNVKENNNITWKYVKYCMTSGNIININKFLEIGGFDEDLFIDEVDHEICYRLNNFGYKILMFKTGIYMEHSLGQRKKFLGFYYREHNYQRVYYIIRNKLKIADEYNVVRVRYYLSIVKKILKILFLESDKIRKMKSVKIAIYDYKHKIFGKKVFKY